MDVFYTKHQTIRGSLADGEDIDKLIIIKKVSSLHLTYQIKVLTYMASTKGKKLIIITPRDVKILPSLKQYVKENSKIVKIEKDLT